MRKTAGKKAGKSAKERNSKSLEKEIEEEGGEGKSSDIPRPEKRRLISSRVQSDPGEGATDRGGVIGRGGGDGVRTRGALDGGKKSSKVRPSTPVKTTLRELRLS